MTKGLDQIADDIANRFFMRGLEPERRESLVDAITMALQSERNRAADAAYERGKELRELAIGSDIADTIRNPDAAPAMPA